jgi:hypothetical protein
MNRFKDEQVWRSKRMRITNPQVGDKVVLLVPSYCRGVSGRQQDRVATITKVTPCMFDCGEHRFNRGNGKARCYGDYQRAIPFFLGWQDAMVADELAEEKKKDLARLLFHQSPETYDEVIAFLRAKQNAPLTDAELDEIFGKKDEAEEVR